MTYLNHPTSRGRRNELWRSNAYDNLEELASYIRNPRIHTGKGYRNAKKAVRGCVSCGSMKERGEFSANQWKVRGPDENRCKVCVEERLQNDNTTDGNDDDNGGYDPLIHHLQNLNLRNSNNSNNNNNNNNNVKEEAEDLIPAQTLTTDMLRQHDRTMNITNNSNKNTDIHQTTERRQFSCPICPKQNRGPNIFFKKVPTLKPIVKCPKCKLANKTTNRNLRRLYPIAKGEEKGYGLYKCHKCRDFWGSSRAVGNTGQNCFKCQEGGKETMVKPFRIEVYKRKKGGAGGERKRMVPREPIGEEEVDERFYGDTDRRRNEAGNDSYGGVQPNNDEYCEGRSELSYDFVSTPRSPSISDGSITSVRPNRTPHGYQHKCSACATGACRTRKVPKSEVRDEVDGNTVSTRASIVTDSSIDKTDFVDRDDDFSGFEEGGGDDDNGDHGAWIQL